MGLVQATKKALWPSDCPSVCRLPAFQVCGTLSARVKRTATVPVCFTLLSYKATGRGLGILRRIVSGMLLPDISIQSSWSDRGNVSSALLWKCTRWKVVLVFGDTVNTVNSISFSVWVCYPNNKGMLWERRGLIAQPFMRRPHKGPDHSFSLSLLSPSGKVSMP